MLQAFDHCKSGNLKALKKIVPEKHPINVTVPFISIFDIPCINSNLLHVTCAYGRLNIVLYLLDHGIEVNYREYNGHYPLHFAAIGRHNLIIELLIKRGAITRCQNFQGFTPLHFYAQYGGIESISSLCPKDSDINSTSNLKKITPLHLAAEAGKSDTIEKLIFKGANVESKTSDLWTPLHFVVNSGVLDAVIRLLKFGVNIRSITSTGDNVLHLAASLRMSKKK